MPKDEPATDGRQVQRRLEWFALTGVFGVILQYVVRRANRRDDSAPRNGPAGG